MIHTKRTVTVGNQESTIDNPVILYRGDKEVEVEFTILGSRFTFTDKGNVISSSNAANGQLVILTPYGGRIFSKKSACIDGKVNFVITKDMTDELREVGFYSIQIRLYDEDFVSRITIPPIDNGIDIREPIASEEATGVVDDALVDSSAVSESRELQPFIGDRYNKTRWNTNDTISTAKMNKIENALDIINTNTNINSDEIDNLNYVVGGNTKRIKSAESDVKLLHTRLDAVTKLESGSTTGDAELIDGRVGSNSNVYMTIGDSIRGQVSDIYTAIDIISNLKIKYEYEWNEGGYISISNGSVVSYDNWKYTDFIEIDGGVTTLQFKTSSDSSLGYNAFYDSNKSFIKTINVGDVTTTVPENARYFRLSIQTNRNISTFNVIEGNLSNKCNSNDVNNIVNKSQDEFVEEYIGIKKDAYKYEWISGGYIDVNNGGVVIYDAYWKYTDYVKLSDGVKKLTTTTTLDNGTLWNAFYDTNYNFLTYFDVGTTTIDVPDDAMYFRLSCHFSRDTHVYNDINKLMDCATVDDVSEVANDISNKTIEKYIGYTEVYTYEWISNGYINSSNGKVINGTSWVYTDFIPLTKNFGYLSISAVSESTNYNNAFYDVNYNFIKAFPLHLDEVSIPVGAVYFRLSKAPNDETVVKNKTIPVLENLQTQTDNHIKAYHKAITYDFNWVNGGYIDNLNGSKVTFNSWKYTDYIEIPEDAKFLKLYTTEVNVNNYIYNGFYDSEKNFITNITISDEPVKIPSNALYFRLSCDSRYTVYVSNITNTQHYKNSIISLNKDVEPFVIQALKGRPAEFGGDNKILSFIHFTDIHARTKLWNRVVEYVNYYEEYIDFAIHTGDYASTNRATIENLYSKGNKCVKPILNVIGNHDTYDENMTIGDKTTTKQLSFTNADEWDVTFMDISDSMTYYKDYPNSKIRIIALDCYYDIDEQCDWLEFTLYDALSKGYHVITFAHELTHPIVNKLDTAFQTLDDFESYGGNITRTKFDKVISDWVADGGTHIVHLAGHEHTDMIGYTENGVLNMICATASANRSWCDADRVEGDKSFDCFNLVAVETTTGVFKIVRIGNNSDHYLREKKVFAYDYINKKILTK